MTGFDTVPPQRQITKETQKQIKIAQIKEAN